MNNKEQNLISKIKFENLYNEIDQDDRKFMAELIEYAIQKGYIFFNELSPSERKKLELEYVKKYKECKNEECLKEYAERIYFGNLFFIIRKSLKAYKKRFNDDIKLYDLLISVFLILPKILKKYEINNKWNARFLSYWEKFIDSILIKTISNNSVHSIPFETIEYYKKKNNFENYDINEYFLKENNDKFDFENEAYYLAQNYESISYNFEDEIKRKNKNEECECLEEIYYYYFKNQLNEKILNCLIKTINSFEILNCIKNKIWLFKK